MKRPQQQLKTFLSESAKIMRICTTAYVKGSREAVIQMLNRVFRGTSFKEVTVCDGDTVETINQKIQQANTILEGYHAEFTLLSFWDDRDRMDSRYWFLMDRPAADTGMSRSKQMKLALSHFESLEETLHGEIDRMKKALEKENEADGPSF